VDTFPWAVVTLVALPLLVLAAVLLSLTPVTWTRRQYDASPRHLWVGARASSADGALVHLQAEVTYRVTSPTADHGAAGAAVAVAEDTLRRAIVSRRLLALPGVGDEVPVAADASPEGLVVDRVVVAAADAEITRELRRLVGGP
jgi:hypothetical protein